MKKVLSMTYASSLTKLCEVNSSFDSGVLRICYTGENRNGTYISKEAIKQSLQTIYNCPIVCNYDRSTDTLGGHDIEVTCDEGGKLHIVNITQPIGVIPESSNVWFEEYEEEDGTIHEYLYADVLLWKRQEAYQKIKNDGITAHSMEITVKNSSKKDGIYYINDFEFTAFALIGVEPCFESSALEVYSKQNFKQQFFEMMQDLKESIKQIDTFNKVDNTHPQNDLMEGGKKVLEEKMKLATEYRIDIKSLDFNLEDFTIEELTKKFEEIKTIENTDTSTLEDKSDESEKEGFSLTNNIISELVRELENVKVECEWGEYSLYWYVDCDLEINEVYGWDTNDGLLYGFTYKLDGDNVFIDFDSKKRKKYTIEDFDEGEQQSSLISHFKKMEERLNAYMDLESKYKEASETITEMETELTQLREFKSETEANIEQNKKDELFARFEDLVGVEAFEELRNNCREYNVETLEEKCYAIRGRNSTPAKFNLENKVPKLKIEKNKSTNDTTEPYGGLFVKYGVDTE